MRPPFDRPDCELAWRGGKRGPASFVLYSTGIPGRTEALARSGVHTLLRAAKLPRAELLHMGATDDMLRPLAAPLNRADCELLLGRIVLDAMYSHDGNAWSGSGPDIVHAMLLGADVIEEHFS